MITILAEITLLQNEYSDALENAQTISDLDAVRITFLSRNGMVATLTKKFQALPIEEKREVGPKLQALKQLMQELYEKKELAITTKIRQQEQLRHTLFDVTAYRTAPLKGSLHPYTHIIQELENIFISMGYQINSGPEVESEFNNFTALNIPLHHPARDMQDTFWLPHGSLLLRTQTSPIQIRTLTEQGAPVAIFATGRVYRNEETDASHDYLFTQGEALLVGKDISLSNLIATANTMLKTFFNNDSLRLRIRPGYFPFVEPGIEIDSSCPFCNQTGCSTCKKTGWIELMGGGLVHPNVLKNCNINTKEFSGFAFGFGIERLAMIKYGINDIRLFHGNQLAFLKQF